MKNNLFVIKFFVIKFFVIIWLIAVLQAVDEYLFAFFKKEQEHSVSLKIQFKFLGIDGTLFHVMVFKILALRFQFVRKFAQCCLRVQFYLLLKKVQFVQKNAQCYSRTQFYSLLKNAKKC